MRMEIAGEQGVIVYFESTDDTSAHQQVMALTHIVGTHTPSWLVDCIPSYASLVLLFDGLLIDHLAVRQWVRQTVGSESWSTLSADHTARSTIHRLPVRYNWPPQNDLARIASHHGCSIEDVIACHSSQTYRVFALGFAPGFAFLGDVPEEIAMPRLATPRTKVPKGAVGIANRQTAIYPDESPGGWNIIGLCPSALFDPHRQPENRLSVGDRVEFFAVTEEQFQRYADEPWHE